MLKQIHNLLLIPALLIGGLLLSSGDTVVSLDSKVSVEGRVHTVGDQPVVGVWVSLIRRSERGLADSGLLAVLGSSSSVIRVRSDHEGRFRLELPVGSYDVRAYESGFQSFSNQEPIEIRANTRNSAIRVALEPTSSVSGRLAGASNRNRRGIVIAHPLGESELLPKRGRIEGDRFTVVGLEPGSYRIEVLIPGYVPAHIETVSLAAGDYLTDLTIDLSRGKSASGIVRDSQGGIEAQIEVVARRVGKGIGLEQTGWSNAKGAFVITGLVPGEYQLTTASVGYTISSESFQIRESDLKHLILVLNPLGRIVGTLSGEVVQGAVVYAIPDGFDLSISLGGQGNGWIAGRLTDRTTGTFEIEGVPGGAYYIMAMAPGHLRTFFPGTSNPKEASAITILNGETTNADAFELLRGSTLYGQMMVRSLNLPIAGATVEVRSLDRRDVSTALTDEEGRFQLSGIAAGRYLIKVHADGYISQFFPGVPRAEEATPLEVDGKRDEINISLLLPIREAADFNEDGYVDVSDLERFVDRVRAGGVTDSRVFDPNQDGLVTYDDFEYVIGEVRNAGKMIDPPTVLEWKSADTEPGQIRASLRVENLVASIGFLAKIHYDPERAEFLGGESGESLFKDGRLRVEEVGPGVLLVVNGSSDRDEREGEGELVSLVFRPREDKASVRLRTEAVVVLLPGGRMASPALPDPVRLSLPPETFYLLQNVPNPFNPETTIAYELPEAVQVKLVIFNLVGQRVRGLVDDFKTSGRYEIRWNGKDDFGRDVGSGVYFYSLEAGVLSTTKRMLLIR